MGINIRQARSSDRAAMDSISARTWGGDDYLSEVLDDWLADPNAHMYVAERSDDGKILGLVRLVCLGPDEWWLEGMRVDPDHYGERIGSLLHQYSVEQAEKLGSGIVRLATSSLNKAVHKMAAEMGFANVGTYAIYRANAQPDPRHTDEFHPLSANDFPRFAASWNGQRTMSRPDEAWNIPISGI